MSEYTLTIKPAVPPRIRHKIQILLEENGYDMHGGGTHKDMSTCAISFSRNDPIRLHSVFTGILNDFESNHG